VFDRALKTIRQYHRLTQAELAGRLSLSKSYLNEIERGHKEPSLDVLRKYSEFFDVPVSSLMLFAERSSGSSVERTRVFAADKVLKMLEWIADGEEEAERHGSEGTKRPHTA
jgi:transcriptional regulator with XRE-family HTH domain